MQFAYAVVLTATLMVSACRAYAQAQSSATAIDKAVLANLKKRYRFNSKVIAHLDLTEPFQTKSQWSLVIAKQPDAESLMVNGAGSPVGAMSVCFVENNRPDCTEEIFFAKLRDKRVPYRSGERPFYELFAGDIVFAGPERTRPLVRIQACSVLAANGDCLASLFLFDYDQNIDSFRVSFAKSEGMNNNQEVRFVESGPLLGNVIVAYPTSNAPFTYFIEVYERKSDSDYARVLRYRGKTRYGDGNRLAVIDSEMPEILRRLGLWKTGDPLPAPPRMPRSCTQLVMRKDVLWCKPR